MKANEQKVKKSNHNQNNLRKNFISRSRGWPSAQKNSRLTPSKARERDFSFGAGSQPRPQLDGHCNMLQEQKGLLRGRTPSLCCVEGYTDFERGIISPQRIKPTDTGCLVKLLILNQRIKYFGLSSSVVIPQDMSG